MCTLHYLFALYCSCCVTFNTFEFKWHLEISPRNTTNIYTVPLHHLCGLENANYRSCISKYIKYSSVSALSEICDSSRSLVMSSGSGWYSCVCSQLQVQETSSTLYGSSGIPGGHQTPSLGRILRPCPAVSEGNRSLSIQFPSQHQGGMLQILPNLQTVQFTTGFVSIWKMTTMPRFSDCLEMCH